MLFEVGRAINGEPIKGRLELQCELSAVAVVKLEARIMYRRSEPLRYSPVARVLVCMLKRGGDQDLSSVHREDTEGNGRVVGIQEDMSGELRAFDWAGPGWAERFKVGTDLGAIRSCC